LDFEDILHAYTHTEGVSEKQATVLMHGISIIFSDT